MKFNFKNHMSDYKPMSELAATHPAFRELADSIIAEHIKRRPEIDAKMNPLRYAAWKIFDNNLPSDNMRKGVMPMYLLNGSTAMDF